MSPHTRPQPSTMHSVAVQLIADRLAIATGMDPRSLDASRLQWIIDARCSALHLPDSLAYAAHLQSTPGELDALIDEVVVQETRFFRDPAVFANLRTALPKLAAAFPDTLRILSAPCGTGQEAYSVAATLVDLGLAPTRFHIDAFDISLSALAFARNAIYPEQALSSLTQITDAQRSSVARHEHHHWKILPALRERVHFERRNLADPGSLTDTYHLILCRNLFIYLHPEARAALAQSLASALVPGGILILGSADRVEELSAYFAPLRPAASFAFTHRTLSAPTPKAEPRRTPVVHRRPKLTKATSAVNAGTPAKPTTADELYQRALQHQQLGNLRSAERRCRQALYLAPTFLPALELLQTLWHQQPNERLRHALTARILRMREAQPEPTSDLAQ